MGLSENWLDAPKSIAQVAFSHIFPIQIAISWRSTPHFRHAHVIFVKSSLNIRYDIKEQAIPINCYLKSLVVSRAMKNDKFTVDNIIILINGESPDGK